MSRHGLAACLGLLALGGCEGGSPPGPPTEPGIDQQLRQQLTQWGVVPIGPMPVQNPGLVALGQALM
ncbi:MAG: hypothetical protein HYV20_05625, partial [Gemmatimonadetes bacterium]|nr:hypothetical protein [Gemmatimonadota bacterium]